MHRTRSRASRTLALLLVLVLVAASCGNRDDDDNGSGSGGGGGGGGGDTSGVVDTSDCPDNDTAGVDGDTITLASSFPQSGLTAAFAQISKGYKAYFDMKNDEGGIDIGGKKYKIEVVDDDDLYDPAKTAEIITDEVGEDGSKAFAVFNVVGTANNITIREMLDSQCVPNVFAATGSPAWGNPEFPWTIGSTLAPYTLEAQAFADYLSENDPDAKVAMLVQNDDFGAAYEEGFKAAIEDTDITVTEVKKYEPGTDDVDSQVTSLAASGADTFFNGATLLACPNALKAASSWNRANTFVSGTCISKTLMGIAAADAEGVIAVTNVKDPRTPDFADDPAMKAYLDGLEKFGADDVDPENGIVAYGWTQAVILVQVLESLDSPSRSALMNAMHSIDGVDDIGLLVDGVEVKTSEDDPYLAENVQLIQYDSENAYFNYLGEVLDFEGKTADVTPEDLINA